MATIRDDNFTRANTSLGGVSNGWTDPRTQFQIQSNLLVSALADNPAYQQDYLLPPSGEDFINGGIKITIPPNFAANHGCTIFPGLRYSRTTRSCYLAGINAVGQAYIFRGIGNGTAGGTAFTQIAGNLTAYTFDNTHYYMLDFSAVNGNGGAVILSAKIYDLGTAGTGNTLLNTLTFNDTPPSSGAGSEVRSSGAAFFTADKGAGFTSVSVSRITTYTTTSALAFPGDMTLTPQGSEIDIYLPPCGTGVSPYTYRLYRSLNPVSAVGDADSILLATQSGITTELTLTDTANLLVNTPYYYKYSVTDSAATVAASPYHVSSVLPPANLVIGGIGNSIMRGKDPTGNAVDTPALQVAASLLNGLLSNRTVEAINRGIDGATLFDWRPGAAYYNNARSAMQASGVNFILCLFDTNEASQARAFTPAQYTTYYTNLINQLTIDFPGVPIMVNRGIYMTPNCNVGYVWNEASVARELSYGAALDAIIAAYPGKVFAGDSGQGFTYFAANYAGTMFPEAGTGTTFFLHPDETGHLVLGEIWAKKVADNLLSASVANQQVIAALIEAGLTDAIGAARLLGGIH